MSGEHRNTREAPTTDPNHVSPDVELDEWEEDEELGCVDLEERLDAALDRFFGNGNG